MTRSRKGAELLTAYESGGYPHFKNRIINGAMMIDQRNAGASAVAYSGATYAVDRWTGGMVGANGTMQRVASGRTDFPYAFRLTGASGSTVSWVGQKIESVNCYDLVGQSVTISFYAAASVLANVAVNLSYANTTDTFGSITNIASINKAITSTLSQYVVTISNLPAGAANGLYLEFVPSGNLGTGTFTITGVQLEKGSTATSFDYRPYGMELALCQRYFQKSFPHDTAPVQNAGISTVSGNCLGGGYGTLTTVRFATVMRSGPTITGFNPSAANDRVRNNSIGADIQYVGTGSNYNSGFVFYPYGANHDSGVQGQQWAWNWTASAEL